MQLLLFFTICTMIMTAPVDGWGKTPTNVPENIRVTPLANHLPFAENRGQLGNEHIRFYTRAAGINVLVEPGRILYGIPRPDATTAISSIPTKATFLRSIPDRNVPSGTEKSHFVNEIFLNAAPRDPTGVEKAEGKVNYFTGNDPKKWKRDITLFNAVSLGEIYPNIEVKLVHRNNHAEKVITVHPQGRVSDLLIKVEGVSGFSIGEGGGLEAETPFGALRFTKPVAYQEINGKKVEVLAAYAIIDGASHKYSFTIGAYDKSAPLVIDPFVEFTTCFGGSTQGDAPGGVALDPEGNIYITGITRSVDFPTFNPIQEKTSDASSIDVFVMKMNAAGDRITYSTFLVGCDWDVSHAIAVDAQGNAYVTGNTYSKDFPIKNGLGIPFVNGPYGFITKINAQGNDLVFSSFLGGPVYSGDTSPQAIAVDSSNHIYVAGSTSSLDFPLATPIQGSYGGGNSDGFISKISPDGGSFIYSTYLGGQYSDGVRALTVDATGNVYAAGFTFSTDFPTKNPLQPQLGDWNQNSHWGDGFIVKIDPAGNDFIFSTYLGGYGYDDILAMAVDESGHGYVTGSTDSINFPTKNPFQALWGYLRRMIGGFWISDAFVTKISPDGQALVYSTFFGGYDGDDATVITVDKTANVIIAGDTGSYDFTLKNSLQKELVPGAAGSFVTKINSSGSGLLYSTLLGSGTSIRSGVLDEQGNLVLVGIRGNYPPCDHFFKPETVEQPALYVAKVTDSPADEEKKLLIIQRFGNGYGTVTATPPNFICDTLFCSVEYAKSTHVRLSPKADPYSDFLGWFFDCSGTAPCSLTMDTDKSVALYFERYSPPPITLQWPPDDWSPEACSLPLPPVFTWEDDDVFTGYEIHFSLEENFLSVPILVHVSKNLAQAHLRPALWRKLLLMPGVSGGTIYWRVVGNTPRGVPSVSSSRSMIVPPPRPLENPGISQTSQDSLPTLSWTNHCNKKFKVRFANNPSFTKSYILSFSLKSPVDNGEPLTKTLTPGQWRAIKARVGNAGGSSVFWVVESCDLLGRCAESDTMNFTLTE